MEMSLMRLNLVRKCSREKCLIKFSFVFFFYKLKVCRWPRRVMRSELFPAFQAHVANDFFYACFRHTILYLNRVPIVCRRSSNKND